MKDEIIIFNEYALNNLLRAVYETARERESLGLLYGKVKDTSKNIRWLVEESYPLQSVERYPKKLDIFEETWKRVENFSLINNRNGIGDFHSHVPSRELLDKNYRPVIPGSPSASEYDRQDMKDPFHIHIIMWFKKSKRIKTNTIQSSKNIRIFTR
ncbi:MAG: hypothetical protein AABW81_01650 [Nanoarchaeota archaeon]